MVRLDRVDALERKLQFSLAKPNRSGGASGGREMKVAVALLIAGGMAFGADEGGSVARCTKPEAFAGHLKQLLTRDWRQVEVNALRKEWPEVSVPDPQYIIGAEAQERQTKCCCQAAKWNTYAAFHPALGLHLRSAPNAPGLWGVGAAVCGATTAQALRTVNELIAAAVPQHPRTRFVFNWEPSKSEQGSYVAAWDAGGERFVLEADVFEYHQEWRGWFELLRRAPVNAVETWSLDNGGRVQVIEERVDPSTPAAEKALKFIYRSDCPVRDPSCREQEFTVLWPRLKAKAEHEGVHRVELEIDGSDAVSMSVRVERKADGSWDLPGVLRP